MKLRTQEENSIPVDKLNISLTAAFSLFTGDNPLRSGNEQIRRLIMQNY